MKTNKIYCGHVLDILKAFPDEAVNCLLTSPPYWGLRDYGIAGVIWDGADDCDHKWHNLIRKGVSGGKKSEKVRIKNQENFQIVSDAKQNLCLKCNAWQGSLGLEPTPELYIAHLLSVFDELKRVLRQDGTCWVNIGDSYGGCNSRASNGGRAGYGSEREGVFARGQPKSLVGIPFRFTLGMLERGWILRNTIIWHKKNCMPSSAKDRFTVDFEYLFFFTKSQKYWFQQQLEPLKPQSLERWKGEIKPSLQKRNNPNISLQGINTMHKIKSGDILNHQGRNKRCVWDIPTRSFKEAHFATFPPALCETPIRAGCPPKGIVLDPFIGSGTVAVVAHKLNRNWVGIELNHEYVKIAEKRIKDETQQLSLPLKTNHK